MKFILAVFVASVLYTLQEFSLVSVSTIKYKSLLDTTFQVQVEFTVYKSHQE
jgi:hypothetical protein